VSDYGYGTVAAATLARLGRRADGRPWVCLDSRHRVAELRGVDAATPNLGELEEVAGRALTGDDEVGEAASELRRRLDARFVLATRGNRGMTLAEVGARPVHIPVFGSDEVADVTGAGDTVLAVLTAALAAGATPLDAARLANYAGGIVVMKLGTATVTRRELRATVERDLAGTAQS
jgi:rfaE bifunctional protein kinase chain/domain